MINNSLDIQALVFEAIQIFEMLDASLQKEFEFDLSLNAPEKELQAKKRQLNNVGYLGSLLSKIFNSTSQAFEIQEKTEMCLINFGISYHEFNEFMKDPLPVMIEQAKQNKKENSVQLPIVFRDMFYKEPAPAVKVTEFRNKPVFSFDQLKTAAENNPGYLKAGIHALSNKIKFSKNEK